MVAAAQPEIGSKRYQIHEVLGTGGMGAVYRATDRLMRQQVALKRLLAPTDQLIFSTRSEGSDQRLALAQEFRYLASLRHPHIISVLDYGFDRQKQPYFTMELLSNAELITVATKGLSLQRKIELFAQILQAVSYLHRRSIIHRDLKPANVLVQDDQVKVLDFGLSTSREQNNRAGGTTSGTLAYMAPEVLAGQPAREMADIYALGLIAYEVLVGHFPFDTANINNLIQEILHKKPEIPSGAFNPSIVRILEKLLAKEPDARFKTIHEIIAALNEASEQTLTLETAAIRESFLQAARLVGRDAELETLSNALEETLGGKGSAWLLAGESGVGKSRLLEEVRSLAMVKGALVLRGQAVSEGSVIYQLWRDILRWLSLSTDDLTGEEASVLKAIVPDIGSLLGYDVPDAPELTPQAAHERLLSVIETLFKRQTQPVVLILEDLHWSSVSLDILNRLLPLMATQPLMIIGSFRDDERPDIPAQVPTMQVLKLNRLTTDAIAELTQSMIGEAGGQEHVVRMLARETEGNAFFLVEVVRALAEESGQLDRIGLVTLPQSIISGGIKQIVQRRLNRVPDWAKSLLEAAAVGGRWLDLDVLQHVEPTMNIQNWLAACGEVAVLEVQDDRWRFSHDKLREGMLNALSPERKAQLNRAIAMGIEAVYPDTSRRISALAHHWSMAGDRHKESHYAYLTAMSARKHYADTLARQYFTQATEALAQLSDSVDYNQLRIDVLTGHASVAFAADPPETNLARLDQAEELAKALPDEDKTRLARIYLWKGRILYYRGSPREAIGYFQQVLPLAQAVGDPQLMAIPASFIAQALITSGQFGKAIPLLRQASEPLEATASWPEWIRNEIFLGLSLTIGGKFGEGMPYVEKGYAKAVETKNLNALGTCLLIYALSYIAVHDAERLLERSQVVLQNAEKTGDRLHKFWGSGFAAHGYNMLGDLEKASQMLIECFAVGETIGPRIVVTDWFTLLDAELALKRGELEKGLTLSDKAVNTSKEMGTIYTEAIAHRVWGQTLLAFSPPRLTEAEEQLMTSLSLLEQGEGLLEAARTRTVLGQLYRLCNDAEKSKESFQKALVQFEATGLTAEADAVRKVMG